MMSKPVSNGPKLNYQPEQFSRKDFIDAEQTTAEEVVEALNARGEKVGLVKVYLYRPFSAKHLVSVLPSTVKRIAVLDRTKEPGALGENGRYK